jgi:hypothetical protein
MAAVAPRIIIDKLHSTFERVVYTTICNLVRIL